MKYPVRLYLGDQEVEFNSPPEILFNYSETELTNPTIVKNSYSKTITIEGTPNNNKLFGHFYNLERIQDYNGSIMGSGFNPLVKTDFTLYYNGSIYESGYFKLDEVRRNDNNVEYDITLYGGLGDFFYNLSFREDGNPMELSDLTYDCESYENIEFDINKDTVADAWLHISSGDKNLWNTINFAPCYNGIPSNLTADKVYMLSGVGPSGSTSNRLGTFSEELTEWETFDLRSYLQRPVLRVKEVIDACCNPDNNGGYTVQKDDGSWDNYFFDANNRYYWDSWMTLPMLTELDVPATVSSSLTVSSLTKETNYLYNVYSGMSNVSNVTFDLSINFTPSDGYSGNSIFLARDYSAEGGITLQDRFIKTFASEGMIMVQMIGYGATGDITALSNMYWLRTPVSKSFYYQTSASWAKSRFEEVAPQTTVDSVKTLSGNFRLRNGQYVFVNADGYEQTLRFTFPSDAEFTQLKLKIVPYHRKYYKYTFSGSEHSEYGPTGVETWSSSYKKSNSWQTYDTVNNLDKVRGTFSYTPKGVTGTTTSFEGFWSNRHFTKKDLLTLGVTPAQFLLSYAKMFGLYFIKDPENKTIRITSRHDFYKRDEIVNINDLVDKGSDIKITPVTPKYQYYDFGLEQVESEAAKTYKKTYGVEYGTQVVNTGYQFEKEHKSVLEGNIFKSAINVLEKDKYFLKPNNGVITAIYNGFSYWHYRTLGGITNYSIDPGPMTGATINPDGLKYYDVFPKPQFHTENNQPSDGSFVLLYYNNDQPWEIYSSIGYHITDDIANMYSMNDGKPCWIMANSTGSSVINVERMPNFTRDIYADDYISNSFDLGNPLATYVPNTYVSEYQGIYSREWKDYISDLYSLNSRVLNCRCLLRERPNPDWLRRFYWFDNSYWRLNRIKDWNISSFDTTEMEFIKVQDIANYDNKLLYGPVVELRLNKYSIGPEGGYINGKMYVSDASGFFFGDITAKYDDGSTNYWDPHDYISPTSGRGKIETDIVIDVPPDFSPHSRTIWLNVETDNDWLTTGAAINQKGNFTGLTIQLSQTEFPRTGGTYTGKVISEEPWSFDEYEMWALPNPRWGDEGVTEFTLNVALNNNGHDRTGALYLVSGEESIEIPITQFGQ